MITAGYAAELAVGDPADPALLVRLGALERSRVWAGELWRLVSAAFLHGGWEHLAMNVGALVLAGAIVERALGPARTLALYLASVVAASAASLLAHDAVVAGASGGVFGTVGALLSLELRRAGSVRRFLGAPHTAIVLASLAAGFVASRIFPAGLPADDFAHAGGFVAGATLAWLLTRPSPRAAWPWAASGAALAAAVVVAAWPRPGTTQFQAGALVRELHDALRREDAREAHRLLSVADARGQRSAALEYYAALVRAHDGDLDGALQILRELSSSADAPLRDEARRAAARIARLLGHRSPGDDRPEALSRGLSYLEESCALGDERSCRDAAAMRAGGSDPQRPDR